MTRKGDDQKRREWELRLARYRASGLTVARFCEREAVAMHTFYYWSRRIPVGAPTASSKLELSRQRTGGRRSNAGPSHGLTDQVDKASASEGLLQGLSSEHCRMVHFELRSGTRISVPADCLDAIRCVAHLTEYLLEPPSTAFHQVVVGNR